MDQEFDKLLVTGEPQGLHFSYSQLNTYLLCPMKYAHNYVYGTSPETKPAALVFGRAIHKAAEVYYLSIKDNGGPLPVEELIAAFEQSLAEEVNHLAVEVSFKKEENLETLRDEGVALLQLFHQEVKPQKVMAVEFPFQIKIPNVNGNGNLEAKLVGYFDLVESDGDSYLIIELKTSSQRFSSLKLDYDLQATVYSYAMSRLRLAKTPESCLVRYDVLLKTKKPAFERYFVTRTEADHRRLVQLINEVLRAIEHRIFYRNSGWACGDCQFRRTCFRG